MNKIKTQNLAGPALDWTVAKCQKLKGDVIASVTVGEFSPSTQWHWGGPIIEREGITLLYCEGEYVAGTNPECFDGQVFMYHKQYGLTPLIAAMRCYVASKLGDEVDIPDIVRVWINDKLMRET